MVSRVSLLLLGASSASALPQLLGPVLGPVLSSVLSPVLTPVASALVPVVTPVLQGVQCLVTDPLIIILQKQASASDYCSSFLDIETATVTATATVTPKVVTSVRVTTTTGATTVATQLSSSVVRTTKAVTVTSTASATVYKDVTLTSSIGCFSAATTLAPAVSKRAIEPRDVTLSLPTVTVQFPTVSALLAAFAATAISSGCSCLSVPTPTTTVTVSTTLVAKTATVVSSSTVIPTSTHSLTRSVTSTVMSTTTLVKSKTITSTRTVVTTAVATNGLVYYAFNSAYNKTKPNINSFHSTSYTLSGAGVSMSGITSNSKSQCTMPDGQVLSACNKASIVFQGFFYAASAGKYTFTIPSNNDDFMTIYSGSKALGATWSNTNYDLQQAYGTAKSKVYTFAQGEVVPMTIFWSNAGGAGSVKLTITSPDGVAHDTDKASFFAPTCASGNPFSP